MKGAKTKLGQLCSNKVLESITTSYNIFGRHVRGNSEMKGKEVACGQIWLTIALSY